MYGNDRKRGESERRRVGDGVDLFGTGDGEMWISRCCFFSHILIVFSDLYEYVPQLSTALST